jgi:hypothetical protein
MVGALNFADKQIAKAQAEFKQAKLLAKLYAHFPVPVDMSFKEIEVALVGGIFGIPPLNILRNQRS